MMTAVVFATSLRHDNALLHHEGDLLEGLDIVDWIFFGRDDVRRETGLQITALLFDAKQPGCIHRHGAQDVCCRYTSFNPAIDEGYCESPARFAGKGHNDVGPKGHGHTNLVCTPESVN